MKIVILKFIKIGTFLADVFVIVGLADHMKVYLLALVFNTLNFLQFCQKASCFYRNSQILSPSLAEEFPHYYS